MSAARALVLPDEASWYLYQQRMCNGPFTREQVVGLILAKRIDGGALLLREDWTDWKPVSESLDDLSNDASARKARETFSGERRIGAPRVPFAASVSLKKETAASQGAGGNISVSGIFVLTAETPFRLGDRVELVVTSPDLKDPFQAQAEVTRFNTSKKFDVGYGFKFVDIDNRVITSIARLVGFRPISEFGDVAKIMR